MMLHMLLHVHFLCKRLATYITHESATQFMYILMCCEASSCMKAGKIVAYSLDLQNFLKKKKSLFYNGDEFNNTDNSWPTKGFHSASPYTSKILHISEITISMYICHIIYCDGSETNLALTL